MIHLASDEEDTDMDRPPVVKEIVSDIVGEFAHKSYFVHLRDGCYYHYSSDKIYGLVRDRPELGPLIWRHRTDSVFENAEVAPLLEYGYEIHFNSGKIYWGNARVDRYRGVDAVKSLCREFKPPAALTRQVSQGSKAVVNLRTGMKPVVDSNMGMGPADLNMA